MKWALNGVLNVLPSEIRQALNDLGEEYERKTEELRLRIGYPMSIGIDGLEYDTGSPLITEDHLRMVLENASQASVHMVLDQMECGYVTLRGGHRIGLSGSAVCRNGKMVTMRYLSSLAIRVARPMIGIAGQLIDQLMEEDRFCNTLILAPPGVGKTTLLRDVIRLLSERGKRISVVDERGEIAALWNGVPQFDIGKHTDVLDGCNKREGMTTLLRSMNPQVIAVDEITQPEDMFAMEEIFGCGVSLLATAHGRNLNDLERRSVYKTAMQQGMFQRIVILDRQEGRRQMKVEVLE